MSLLYFTAGQETAGLTPQQIEIRLAQLMKQFARQRSIALADNIARHFKALCVHPDFRATWEERCTCRRLARQWSCLAWLNAAPRPLRGPAVTRIGPEFDG